VENPTHQPRPLLVWFTVAFISVLLLKTYLAAVLDLYSDEIFYWLASTRLALAYSDLPFMTALLAGIGSALDPGNSLAVRLLFLLLGSSLPLLVYWLALPFSDRQQALESAILTLCLPLGGFLGLLAVPDVPLIFFGLLSIGFFHRALHNDRLQDWLATGVFVALGLCTHYRFFLYPLAAICFLVLCRTAHSQWRNPRLWLAMAIACLGLIPILWFNLGNQLSSASFYLVERHPWEFSASGLLHVFKQAGLVTPPLYLLFLFCLWQLLKKSRTGHQDSLLLLCFSVTNLSVYLILAPWTDADSTSIHWPLSGYFPLLVVAPMALRLVYDWAQQIWDQRRAMKLTLSIPVLGFTGTLLALAGVGSQAFQAPLQAVLGTGVLSNKMAGWREFAGYSSALSAAEFGQSDPVVITDNYYTAAQVKFAGISEQVFTLDRDKAVRDGRITQLRLWGMDESALPALAGRSALYINEDSTLILAEKIELMTAICEYSTAIEPLADLSLYAGDKAFSFYRVNALQSPAMQRAFPCPYPIQAWIDRPEAGASVQNELEIAGWAFSEDIGIAEIELLIDNQPVSRLDYGIERIDVVSAKNVRTDPGSPNLGFGLRLDSRMLTNGEHSLALLIRNNQGTELVYGERTIFIANPE
jgi:4-amino-4-deoxy-L-arabinose transferase-like glycosyltransferase